MLNRDKIQFPKFTLFSKINIGLFLSCFLFFSMDIFSQSEKDKMNDLLKKELGIEEKKTEDKSKSPKKDNNPQESNPIEERYKKIDDGGSNLVWSLVKIIAVLGILTAGAYYVLRYLSRQKSLSYPVHGVMQVLSSIPINAGKQLQIVDISGVLLVIGVSEQSINLITEITSPDLKQRIFQMRDSFEPPTESFLKLFQTSIKNFQKQDSPDVDNVGDESVDKLKAQQMDKLEKLKQERESMLKNLKDK